MMELQTKRQKLTDILKATGGCAVAFSSGVDSTFLLAAAKEELGDRVLAVTVKAAWVPDREMDEAVRFCAERGIEHVILTADADEIEGFRENPPDRCYLCKTALFTRIRETAAEHSYVVVAEGSNTDDDGDYRPGMRAIRELGIASPLKEAGLSKAEIRELSREMELPTWKKPSAACLASRVPYGERVTDEKLRMVEEAEDFLTEIGFEQVRVRVHEGGVARIEVSPDRRKDLVEPDRAAQIHTRLREIGFSFIAADLMGYRTGSLNEGLAPEMDPNS